VSESTLAGEQPQTTPDKTAALFANMVMQQTNMTMMFLGKIPHPESGQPVRDLDAARMFIDQLEMIEVKTKGNLDKREAALLKQSLTGLRMAFVEAANEQPSEPPKDQPAPAGPAAASPAPEPGTPPISQASPSTDDAESRKKFSKKY